MTAVQLPDIEHIEIPDPEDARNMPIFGGDVDQAHRFLTPGEYRGYGHGGDHEGSALLVVTDVDAYAEWEITDLSDPDYDGAWDSRLQQLPMLRTDHGDGSSLTR